MKHKMLLLILAAMLFSISGAFAQPDLNIVWEKDIWPTEIKFAKFSKDGQWIYCAINNTILKMNPQNGEFVSTFENTDVSDIFDMNISFQGNFIVTHNGDGAVNLWDTRTEKAFKNIQIGASNATFMADENKLYIASQRSETFGVVIYNITSDNIDTVINYNLKIHFIRSSQDGKYFATGSRNNNFTRDILTLWSADSLKPIATLEDVEGDHEYKKLQFSNDSKYLGSLKMWNFKLFDLETNEMKYFSGIETHCTAFSFYNNNDFLIKVGDGSTGFLSLYSILSLDTIINKKNIYPVYIIEQNQINDIITTYAYGGMYHNLYTNQYVDVIDYNQTDLQITVNNNIRIFFNDYMANINIIDSLSRSINNIDLTNNPQITYIIENTLPSGTYICTITTQDGKTYSKSFQVVR